MSEQARTGRVYTEPEPQRGAHPGFRGRLVIDVLGVHISHDCEVLTVPNAKPGEWPMGAWSLVEVDMLVPWHRVMSIEWEADQSPSDHGIEP